MTSVISDVLVILLILALLFFAGVGVSASIRELLDSPDRHWLRQEQRTRQAEQEIIDIGQWEQQAIITEVLRRTANGRPGVRLSADPTVIDGEWTER